MKLDRTKRKLGRISSIGSATRHGLSRRLAIAGAIVVIASPADAQSTRMPRLGVIHWETAAATDRVDELRRVLGEVGYVEGRNIAIEWRWADRSPARAAAAVADLDRLGVDVMFVHSTPTVHAAKATGTRTPIVMVVSDPIATGIVTSLARPGGTITGVGSAGAELAPKRLEMLRDLLPGLARVAFLGSALDQNAPTFIREVTAAGALVGVAVTPFLVEGPGAFDDAFARMAAAGLQAVIVQPLFLEQRALLAQLQLRHRIPAVGDQAQFARDGMLVSYGPDRRAMMARVAAKIDAIVRGARAGDLPVELPTILELVLNQKTAAALGLTVPPAILVRADEVIE